MKGCDWILNAILEFWSALVTSEVSVFDGSSN